MSDIIGFDEAYRRLFSHREMIEELIRSFVQEEFVHEIDFSTLKRLSEIYVTRHFKKRELDRIWEVHFRDRKIYFYILLEFQSTVDHYMSLRILNYITLFYLDLLKVEKEMVRLPVVFPILLYNGGRDWTAPVDFRDLVDSPFISAKLYIPEFRYYKIVEKDIPEHVLIELNNAVAAAFLVDTSNVTELKNDPEKLKKLVKDLMTILRGVADRELKRELIVWINRIFGKKRVTVDFSRANEEEVAHMIMESIQTLKKEGKIEGKIEGEIEGKRVVALKMKEKGFDIDTISDITGLSKEEIEKLK